MEDVEKFSDSPGVREDFWKSSSGKSFCQFLESEIDSWFAKMISLNKDSSGARDFYAGGIRFGTLLLSTAHEDFSYSKYLNWKLKEDGERASEEKKRRYKHSVERQRSNNMNVINSQ